MKEFKTKATTKISIGAILDPFHDLYQLESQAYVYKLSQKLINNPQIGERIERLIKTRNEEQLKNQDIICLYSLEDYINRYGKKQAYEASSLFKTAHSFYINSISSGQEIKPILLYYSLFYLHASLGNLFFLVRNPSPTHGLQVKNRVNLPDNERFLKESSIDRFIKGTEIKVNPYGAFARSKDLLSILGINNMFCLISEKDAYGYKLKRETTISFQDLLNFNHQSVGFETVDIKNNKIATDYLCMFVLSSLARYNSTIWRLMYSGIGDSYADILGVLHRFRDNVRNISDTLIGLIYQSEQLTSKTT